MTSVRTLPGLTAQLDGLVLAPVPEPELAVAHRTGGDDLLQQTPKDQAAVLRVPARPFRQRSCVRYRTTASSSGNIAISSAWLRG